MTAWNRHAAAPANFTAEVLGRVKGRTCGGMGGRGSVGGGGRSACKVAPGLSRVSRMCLEGPLRGVSSARGN